jgi:hypothetical protein
MFHIPSNLTTLFLYSLLSIAYAAASIKGGKMEKESLLSSGVRARGIDDLVKTINEWIDETKPSNTSTSNTSSSPVLNNSAMMILPDAPFQPQKAWYFFSYKPNKKTGLAAWESSYNRFCQGEHPQAIAISPINGRPIQISTVIGHIMDGLLAGRPANLKQLSSILPPPNKSEWEQLLQLEVETGIDVTGDPKTSGKHGEAVRITDFLEPLMGQEFATKDFKERSPEEKIQFEKWCMHFKWFCTLRRIGFNPSFLN